MRRLYHDLGERGITGSLPANAWRFGNAAIIKARHQSSRAEGVHRSRISGHTVPSGQSSCMRQAAKQHSAPCHHALAEALRAYIAAAIPEDLKGCRPGTERLLRPL
jgi:hypothetical protein